MIATAAAVEPGKPCFFQLDNARMEKVAKRWFVSGIVQGVGFRFFVQNKAKALGLSGWVRNLDDGRVEAYAAGAPKKLNELAAALYLGPRLAQVRHIEEQDAAVEKYSDFFVR